LRFRSPKLKRNITFKQKNPKDCRFSLSSLKPAVPASGTSIVIENMMNGRPHKNYRVFREDGTIKSKRIK